MKHNAQWASLQDFIPREYQKIGIKFLLEHACAGLFFDVGLGKTSCALAAWDMLRRQKVSKRALIVAPKHPMYHVWPAEITKWYDFHHLRYSILHGPKKEARLDDDSDLFIINYEGLAWLLQNNRLARLNVDTVVFDELNKLRHTNSQRFRMLKPHLNFFQRRWGLTASPVPRSVEDLFGQVYVLDQGASLGRYVTHFRQTYFTPDFMGWNWVLKDGAEKLVYAKIKTLALRMDAKDWLKLPELQTNRIKVTLPATVAAQYKRMDTVLAAELDKKEVLAVNVAAALNKCQQIANGAMYDEQHKAHVLHTEKAEALKELVDSLVGRPLFVAYGFQHDLTVIRGVLGDVPHIGGGTSDREAARLITLWNQGKLPVLLGHPASVGHGLNLQGSNCENVCFYSLTWDLDLRDQFIGRVHRSGNKASHVVVHYIVAEDTVDEIILAVLKNKSNVQAELLSALKQRRRTKKPRS